MDKITVYTEADMISFGNYLLSNDRYERLANHPEFPDKELLQERSKFVSDADISNWKEKNPAIKNEN